MAVNSQKEEKLNWK